MNILIVDISKKQAIPASFCEENIAIIGTDVQKVLAKFYRRRDVALSRFLLSSSKLSVPREYGSDR